MKTLAIIGASYLQLPLVRKAKAMGLRTICFAWEDGAVCRDEADVFYPISVVDKIRILEACRKEQVAGITSIASDVAVPTISFVASRMGLCGNTEESAAKSTNKFLMRQALRQAGVSVPNFALVDGLMVGDVNLLGFKFPLIVKPVDRSGSMGVVKVMRFEDLARAVADAYDDSLCGQVLIEECVQEMREVSVEGISWDGDYHLLAITDKVTTGAPHYVELGHHQPARLSDSLKHRVLTEVKKGVSALDIRCGATHAELMITPDDRIFMTEIGARMGGDFIGSHLVELSTGYDFLSGVVKCAIGTFDGLSCSRHSAHSGVWFYTPETRWVRPRIMDWKNDPRIVMAELQSDEHCPLTCSADRSGYFIYRSDEGRFEAPRKG